MKDWFSALELAGLPGLPTTVRGVAKNAIANGWSFRLVAGKGGPGGKRREYYLPDLPAEARTELARRALPQIPPPAVNLSSTTTSGGAINTPSPAAMMLAQRLVGAAAVRADGRRILVDACDTFIRAAHLSVTAGTRAFCDLYNAGQLDDLDQAVRQAVRHVTPNSLNAWRKKLAQQGTAALAGKYGAHRKGSGKIENDAEVRELIVGLIAHQPHASAKHVMQALRARLPQSRVPKYRTVQRFMASWKAENASIFGFVSNPDAWKNQTRASFGNASAGITRLNQVWETDATPSDVMLKDGRHAVVGVIDVYSRRVKVLVTKTSKAVSVLAVLRRAILDWGAPEILKTDNGKDFASAHVGRALRDLQIEQRLCKPFTPEGKPHIERFFGTMTRQLFEQLPGYIGHDVAGRQEIRARRSFAERFTGDAPQEIPMTAAELQVACDTWCETIYAREAHAGLKGQSPFAMASAWTLPVRRVADERVLDVLLAEAPDTSGLRTVGKKGIALDNTYFIGAELGAYVGRKVHVRYDAADMGRVYVFNADDQAFICVAEAPERLGFDPREMAMIARATQKQIVLQGRRDLKRLSNSISAKTVVNDVLAHGAAESSRIVAFPKPGESIETPALVEAAAALGQKRKRPKPLFRDGPVVIAELTDDEKADADAMIDALEAGRAIAPAPTLAVVDNDRPSFTDDVSFARWVQANPDRATDSDRAYLAELLADPNFRELLEWPGNGEAAAG